MTEKDEWKDIVDYEGLYKISNTGKVFGVKRNKELSLCLTKKGYLQVGLSKNSIVKKLLVHRLVAEAFLSDWDANLTVDHIDNNKTNNKVSNLQMLTDIENLKKAIDDGLITQRKAVVQIDKQTNQIISEYNSITEANIAIGKKKDDANIGRVCNNSNNRTIAYGFKWRWK